MAVYALLMRMAPIFAPNRRKEIHDNPLEVLLTGTFYSDNWIIPHLRPMAASKYCRRVRMAASNKVPPMDKVEAVYAPAWLTVNSRRKHLQNAFSYSFMIRNA